MGRDLLPNASAKDLSLMEQLLKAGNVRHKYAVRIQAVLNRAAGKSTTETAEFLGINIMSVSRHVIRFNDGGVESLLHDKSRHNGLPPTTAEIKNRISQIVCNEKPEGASHWSVRNLADRVGVSHTTVHKILRERGLKPHQVQSFQFSNDPDFEKKLDDVVGLYLSPPENAVVLCVDEKSQIQALERSQPILPLLPGVPERQSHDYYRHGTTTLFAALNVATGSVLGECKQQHKAVDYISFLKKIDRYNPKGKVLHLIVDNYSAHKSGKVAEFLESRPGRFVIHYTPTHSSWLNLVERWFAEITNKQIRRESWTDVAELKQSIKGFIRIWNESGKKFHWIKTSEQIKDRIEHAKGRYEKS
jgi:transposase